jgi:dephospho-CoA kinase
MPNRKIALTGGIATGKTTVANRFRELGAIILDADQFARQAAEPGTPSHAALRAVIGRQFFNPDGTLRRADLRRRIIREPALLERVNTALHPYILEAMRSEWGKQIKNHPGAIVLFDIPLLFEGGIEKDFDLVILVYCTPEIQLQRLMLRDRLTQSEAERTLSIQLPIDSKKPHSDYIIENSGDLERTLLQVDEVWSRISKR